jgi:hypothetical protein
LGPEKSKVLVFGPTKKARKRIEVAIDYII